MKETAMSNVVAPAVSTTVVLNAQVEMFANQYRLCVQKTASAILELASVVVSAEEALSKSNFKLFLIEIGANESKKSFITKLKLIAKKSARFIDIQNKLPPSYTTLYSLSQMTDEKFALLLQDDVISPRMTALTLSPYLNKKSNSTDLEVLLSFKNVLESDKFIAYKKIQDICTQFKIELKSKIDSPFTTQIKKLSDLNAVQIEDVTPKAELETA